MKNQEVTITDSIIHFKDNPRNIVMHEGSKELMEIYSNVVCQNGGTVLDVGFGMGYSADRMSELAEHYHCIEINPQIYEKAIEWSKGKPNVTIWYGDWKDLLPTMTHKFDGIFMDTHDDPNYSEFEEYCKPIANEGCTLSIFNYFVIREEDNMNKMVFINDIKKFPRLVEPTHVINWTVFKDGEFVRARNNRINSVQDKLI